MLNEHSRIGRELGVGPREHRIWNVAADASWNDNLEAAGGRSLSGVSPLVDALAARALGPISSRDRATWMGQEARATWCRSSSRDAGRVPARRRRRTSSATTTAASRSGWVGKGDPG